MKKTLEIALQEYGVKEVPGRKHNARIIEYFTSCGLDTDKMTDETAWCSAFINWVCKEANAETSGKLNARSWLNVGCGVSNPEPGDVVVLWRDSPESWKGHVGIFVKQTRNYVYIIGGNQSNAVNIKAYPKERVLDYRCVL